MRLKASPNVRVLLEGRPGIGKTTAARRLVELLQDAEVELAGFTTEELREDGKRVGFAVETVSGERGVLAHVGFPGPARVGRYGVDLKGFEAVVLEALRTPPPHAVVVIDEFGKMELGSAAFRERVDMLLDRDVSLVATVHVFRHPFTDALKRRPDLEVVRMNERNRDNLPESLARRILRRGAA